MTVKRDYGSFAKATQKLLPSFVAPHGYADVGHGFFARSNDGGWLEGFGLQQTQYGDGSFCINMGINVPSLKRRWLNEEDTGLTIAFRLSDRGADQQDAWLPAGNKQELLHSFETLALWMPLVEPWFARFKSMLDVAHIYRSRTNLVALGENEWHLQLMAANYGFLLAEAGDFNEARLWLAEAERLMALPVYFAPNSQGMVHTRVKGARLQKPSPNEIRQLEAVRLSLRFLKLPEQVVGA